MSVRGVRKFYGVCSSRGLYQIEKGIRVVWQRKHRRRAWICWGKMLKFSSLFLSPVLSLSLARSLYLSHSLSPPFTPLPLFPVHLFHSPSISGSHASMAGFTDVYMKSRVSCQMPKSPGTTKKQPQTTKPAWNSRRKQISLRYGVPGVYVYPAKILWREKWI